MNQMQDWGDYNKIHTETHKVNTDKPVNPSLLQYLGIKLVDNWILIVLIFFVILFAVLGIKNYKPGSDMIISNWALHAGELCLGVFLGLFKKSN